MTEEATRPGLHAVARRCAEFNCLDENDCCKHCGQHFSYRHEVGCPHADEPVDECDTTVGQDEDGGDDSPD